MADLILSPVLDVIIENLATCSTKWFGNWWNANDNIKKLQHTLPMVQAILEDAEEQQASNTAVRIWLSKFKEVAFSAEDLLLTSQRVLDFRAKVVMRKSADGISLKILDSSIQSLLLLKFLDLSHTVIRKLPSEIETLSGLETLNLSNCCHLEELPDLTRMHSLRHLNNDGCKALTRMIKSSARVGPSQIQTVPLFVVGGVVDLNFLESLNVRGSLKITHLENATLGFSGLKVKEGLKYLGLYWGSDDGCPSINPEEEDVVSKFDERTRTQSSRPSLEIQIDPQHGEEVLMKVEIFNCNLKRLLVKGYPGSLEIKSCPSLRSLPRDLGNLADLKSLTIRWCEQLSSLPQSLQNLSALESLEISDCHSLSSLPEGGNGGLSNLRSLSIENCNNLTSLSLGQTPLCPSKLEHLVLFTTHVSNGGAAEP
ncbi:hypothetical protein TIFTF001_032447 [Ficus carica]|uniref:Rx N-terminal domain-containing protein n=1 Tax=Ficus carica TaxID=3494 RepID=A0AA88DX79_FICCA|nr:hypothetical protein TIFTF001_032447 [Ficus carica]